MEQRIAERSESGAGLDDALDLLSRHVAVHVMEEMPDSLWLRGAPNEPHVNAGTNRGGDKGERDREHGVPPKLVLKA
jgi:hypothetical protein